jgi:hypothetical protein
VKQVRASKAGFFGIFGSILEAIFPAEVVLGRAFWGYGVGNAGSRKPASTDPLAREKIGVKKLFRLDENHNILCYSPRSPQQAVVGCS